MSFRQKKEKNYLEPGKLDSLYKRHIRGAYVRSGSSLIMWAFLLAAFLFDIIGLDSFLGCTICAAYLIMINPPTLFLLKRIKKRHTYEYFSIFINLAEIFGYTLIIYFLGGIIAAYLTLMYAILIAYVGMVSPGRNLILIAGVSSASFIFIVLLEYFNFIPHQNVNYPVVYDLKTQIMILFVVTGYLFVAAFVSSYTGNRLRKSRRKLEESEKRYSEHIENIGDVIYVLDGNRRIRYINKALEKLIGIDLNDLRQKKFSSIVDLKSHSTIDEVIKKQVIGEETGLFELNFKGGKGFTRTIELREKPIWEGNSIKEIHGMGRDITEKKRFEESLIQRQRMEAIGSLSGGIAHNFNNILVGIMGYSEFLLSQRNEDDKDYKALKIIHDGTVRASELTRDLLNITRRGEHKPTDLSLNDIVEMVLPLITGTFDKSIEIKTHLADDIMIIEGDSGQLEQSLLNLCINARDAMPVGGKLIIETYNQRVSSDFVSIYRDAREGDYTVLSVTDSGIGMSHEVMEHIFEPFFSTKKEKGGTGMGLSTVYGILENHRGLVTVFSEEGKGTTFKLYFPGIEGSIKEIISVNGGEKFVGNATILLVDDEKVVIDMWSDFLSEKGYQIIIARDGEEALKVFKEKKSDIDLVILDYVMPKMGGKETLVKMKEIDPNLKVLITSGYSENGQAKKIVTEGANGFIQKPAPLGELHGKIIEVLSQKSK